MVTNYKSMTTDHLGPEASESDLAEFRALCSAVQRTHPEMDDDAVTEAVFGDGDYFQNARDLGVDASEADDSLTDNTVQRGPIEAAS